VAGDWAENVVNKIKRGMLRGLSVRGLMLTNRSPSGVKKIGHLDLAEISVTAVPVQSGALFSVASKAIEAAEDTTAADLEALAEHTRRLHARRSMVGASSQPEKG